MIAKPKEGRAPTSEASVAEASESQIAKFRKHVREKEIENPDGLAHSFFKRNQIIALWNKLRRERKAADVSVRDAWETLAGTRQTNLANQKMLIDFLVLPPGAWQKTLLDISENKKTRRKKQHEEDITYHELEGQLGSDGAEDAVTKGMWKSWSTSSV